MRVFIIATIVLLASPALAFEIYWSEYTDPGADGLRVYMDSSANGPIIDEIPTTDTAATYPDPTDGVCHYLWMRAFMYVSDNGVIAESPNSEVVKWCPDVSTGVPDPVLPDEPVVPDAPAGLQLSSVSQTVTWIPTQ